MGDTIRARLVLRSPSGDSVLDAGERVTADNVGQYEANADTVREAREMLMSLGFRIVDEGPTGIAFTGDADRFEDVFGTPAAAPIPVPKELSGVAAGVVLPHTPELFP
jgi:hypothetical protein